MKTRTLLPGVAAMLVAATPTPAISQGGPLTPPVGAPAPTMKTLDQIEPRIPLVEGAPGVTISNGTTTINAPGSYYLTANYSYDGTGDAIRILANGVTLDLMGFAIIYSGTGNADDAIDAQANNVTIRNGSILSTTTLSGNTFTVGGFGWGIWSGSPRRNLRVENLLVEGVRHTGIYLSLDGTSVQSCKVRIAAVNGIIAGNVYLCSVDASTNGIEARSASRCNVNVLSRGIFSRRIDNSNATSSGGTAISVIGADGVVADSHGISSGTAATSYGILNPNGNVHNSIGVSQGGHGIVAAIVTSSRGESNGTHGAQSHGIFSTGQVIDSMGMVTNSTGGNGIDAELVVNSTGNRSFADAGFFGIRATQATSSRAIPTQSIDHKYNMP